MNGVPRQMTRESMVQRWLGATRRQWCARVGWLAVIIVAVVGVVSEATSEIAPSYFWEIVLVQVLYAMSVNVLIGYAHLPSFGQAAFFGTGAYAVALTIQGVPFLASLLIAMAVSGVLALFLGLIAVRTSGITFANVTLAFGQMLYLVAANTDLVGGENGKTALLPESMTPQGFWLVLVACVVLGCWFVWWIFRTPFGETVVAIRDNPERAASLGVSVFRYRLSVFVLSSTLAGLAGALFAAATGIVTADTLYWTRSGEPIIMCLLGGTRRFFGPVVGAIALTTLLQQVGQGSSAYLIWVGSVLLVVLIVMPRGLLTLPSRLRSMFRTRAVGTLRAGTNGGR